MIVQTGNNIKELGLSWPSALLKSFSIIPNHDHSCKIFFQTFWPHVWRSTSQVLMFFQSLQVTDPREHMAITISNEVR